jgi:hypothetical protein
VTGSFPLGLKSPKRTSAIPPASVPGNQAHQYRRDLFGEPSKLDRSAGDDHQNDRLAGAYDRFQHLLLLSDRCEMRPRGGFAGGLLGLADHRHHEIRGTRASTAAGRPSRISQ